MVARGAYIGVSAYHNNWVKAMELVIPLKVKMAFSICGATGAGRLSNEEW